jgi:biotin carboxylase
MDRQPTILCVSSFFKGNAFLRACQAEGARVVLLVKDEVKDEAWARDAVDEFFHMPDLALGPDIINGVSYLARDRHIDQIIPLDDYDVETAAALREHLRLPGMGDSLARHFRDKLAMRTQARNAGVPVPDFVHTVNYAQMQDFMERVPAPWILKPRSEAGSIGLTKLHHGEELWRSLDELGDKRAYYLMERFLPGPVFHVDSVVWEGQVLFNIAHRYGNPPMQVYQGGGAFTTRTLDWHAEETAALFALNQQVISALGMVRGVTHAEYIRADADGQFYFLESAARVGGANIDEMVAAATGLNLWVEWARLTLASVRGEPYQIPPVRQEYAGLILSLARQEYPDLSHYTEREIVWRLQGKKHHAGLIVASPSRERVGELLTQMESRFAQDFLAVLPPSNKPT